MPTENRESYGAEDREYRDGRNRGRQEAGTYRKESGTGAFGAYEAVRTGRTIVGRCIEADAPLGIERHHCTRRDSDLACVANTSDLCLEL